MAEQTIVYWRDIPAQVVVRCGRSRVSRELPSRFATAIDVCAMRNGLKDSDAYLAEWRRGEPVPCPDDDMDQVLDEAIASLDAAFTAERLGEIIAHGGFADAV